MTFTFPPAVRTGTITSPSAIIPATVSEVGIEILLPVQADRDNPAVRLDLSLETSADNGATWKSQTDVGWIGGTGTFSQDGTIANPPPAFGLSGTSVQSLAGQRIRLKAKIQGTVTIGATVVAL
jgi:hypothetical protein